MDAPTDDRQEAKRLVKRAYGKEISGESPCPEADLEEKKREEQLEKEEKISRKLLENKEMMIAKLGVGTSFDVIFRELVYGNKEVGMVYVNGFAKDSALIPIMTRLSQLEREEMVPNTLKHLLETYIPHMQVELVDKMQDVVTKVLSGSTALFLDREEKALIVDAKTFPARSPQEPEVETVVRGSRDGFIETILANTALTRRRIRDERLRIEILQAGERSKTDIAVAYLKDVADPSLLEEIKEKIDAVDVDGLPMADKQVEELIIKKRVESLSFGTLHRET